MRIGEIVYFSPNYRFIDLDWDSKENLISAFRDRVKEFYFIPIQQLNDTGKAFAAGVICVTTIDFLAKIQTGIDDVGPRIEQWLIDNLPDFAEIDPENRSRNLARRFYKEFRTGLVHEGRIKNGGQFSYDCPGLFYLHEPVMIVNPNILLNGISESFNRYMENVSTDEIAFQRFRSELINCFEKDMEVAQR